MEILRENKSCSFRVPTSKHTKMIYVNAFIVDLLQAVKQKNIFRNNYSFVAQNSGEMFFFDNTSIGLIYRALLS